MKKYQLILLFSLTSFSCAFPQGATPTPAGDLSPIATESEEIAEIVSTPISAPALITQIEDADEALFFGDWDQALVLYDTATTYPSKNIQSAAYYGTARAHFAIGDMGAALQAIDTLINQYPTAPETAYAFFLKGECFKALDRHLEAAQAYQVYLDRHPGLIDQYVLERKGDMLSSAGEYQNAINAYHQALQYQSANRSTAIQIKIGYAYNDLEDYETAVVLFEDLLSNFRGNDIQAQILFAVGESYFGLGETDKQYNAYQQIVNDYPFSHDAYQALYLPIDATIFDNHLNRGLIYFNAGESAAVAAFDQHIATEPNHDDTAYYYKGLSLKATGQYSAAITTWEKQIERFPEGQYIAMAYDEIASVQWQQFGDYPTAIEIYEDFAANASDHPDAGKLLHAAGWVAERSGDFRKAAQLWERVGIEYSLSPYAFDAFFQSGITQYYLKEYLQAQDAFQSTLALASNPHEQAQAYYWTAKAQAAAGDEATAYQFWVQTIDIDPTGYYSVRAAEMLAGETPFTTGTHHGDIDTQVEKTEAEAWMISSFSLPTETNFKDQTSLMAYGAYVRGTELWVLGDYEAARLEFVILSPEIKDDSLKNYLLMNHLTDLGLYRLAANQASHLLSLAGDETPAKMLQVPDYLNRVRYAVHFESLIFPLSEKQGIDPLFINSLVYYGSLFEPFLTASTGNRGLMQLSPATGELMHQRTAWPLNYTADDLYRPWVNIEYGVKYFSSQWNFFGGNRYLSLAAYAGSSGSATAWQQIALDDPDLFVEIIRAPEVRRTIKEVYEIYNIYKLLYANQN